MIDFEHLDWNQDADLRRLLETYVQLHDESRDRRPEFDGWLPRLTSLDGVEADRLPVLHGKLIALGFLKFQIANRTTGMQYHVDPAGRQALSRTDGRIDGPSSDEEEQGDDETLAAA